MPQDIVFSKFSASSKDSARQKKPIPQPVVLPGMAASGDSTIDLFCRIKKVTKRMAEGVDITFASSGIMNVTMHEEAFVDHMGIKDFILNSPLDLLEPWVCFCVDPDHQGSHSCDGNCPYISSSSMVVSVVTVVSTRFSIINVEFNDDRS